MKKWILAPTFALAFTLTGCMSTSDNSEQAATMNRDEAIMTLSQQITEVGYNEVAIQPGVDEFLNICASILERQHSVMSEYRTQAENHADVQAFLYAHQEKTPEQLQQAIVQFDATATTEEEKIGPKITAYQSAIDEVANQNAELAIEITAQVAKASYVLSQYGTEVAKATTLGGLDSLFSDEEQTADNNLGLAILRAKEQLGLASDANELISIEQQTIEAIDSLQAELEAKS